MKYENIDIFRLNHDAFKIKGSKLIYIDPFKIGEKEKADYILVSHNHFDHLSMDDIKKVLDNKTVIIASINCDELKSLKSNKAVFLKPGEHYDNEIKVEATYAYNTNKNFHPKSYNGVGFIINIDGKRVYHAGDTDLIPEMKNIKNIDIALLPVSGTYVMTAKEAAEAANIIKPNLAIPMHWGSIVGSKEDAEEFKMLYKGDCEVV